MVRLQFVIENGAQSTFETGLRILGKDAYLLMDTPVPLDKLDVL